jgi:deoxycytidylate deaminase
MESHPTRLYNRDETHLRLARLTARNSTAVNYKLGAVLARGRKVLGVGFNDPLKTHPSSNTYGQKIHAELAAIINARCDLNGATLYVFRSGKNERPLLSKPCLHCQALIEREGIKTVVFTINDGFQKMTAAELLESKDVRSNRRSTCS